MGRWQHLETERCYVRLPQLADAAAIVRYYTDNCEFLRPFEPIRPDELYTEAWWRDVIPCWHDEFVNDRAVHFIIVLKEAPGHIIGTINFTEIVRGVFQACTLGYSLSREHQGRGLMRESLEAAIAYMFEERKLHRIMANYMPRNARSGGLLKRLGFLIEGVARDYMMINGEWEDHVLTSLVNDEWTPDERTAD